MIDNNAYRQNTLSAVMLHIYLFKIYMMAFIITNN